MAHGVYIGTARYKTLKNKNIHKWSK